MCKVILSIILAATIAVNANLIVNGGFESPDASGTAKGYTRYSGTQIDGWVIPDGYQVDLCHELWISYSGLQSLDLNPDVVPGSIAQQLQTIPQAIYELTFMLAGNPTVGHPPYLKKMEVRTAATIDGAAIQSQEYQFDVTNQSYQNMGWQQQTWLFTAQGTTTWLVFENLTDGNCGVALDDIAVEMVQIPEPATMLLAAIGGLFALRKK